MQLITISHHWSPLVTISHHESPLIINHLITIKKTMNHHHLHKLSNSRLWPRATRAPCKHPSKEKNAIADSKTMVAIKCSLAPRCTQRQVENLGIPTKHHSTVPVRSLQFTTIITSVNIHDLLCVYPHRRNFLEVLWVLLSRGQHCESFNGLDLWLPWM